MPEFQHVELRAATKRQQAALQRMHRTLGAKRVKVGRWPFRRREWQPICPSCGWESEQTVPFMPPEVQMTEDFLLRELQEEHLVDALRKLTFREVWLGGRDR